MKILVYHGIVKKLDNFDKFFRKHILIDDFKKQIDILRKRYRILTLEEFNCKWWRKELKSNEALIFFDDCYRSALNGAEVLESFKIPAVFAVSSDLVNKGYSWTDDIEKALLHTREKEIKFNGLFLDISTERKKINTILNFKKYFKSISADIIGKELKKLIRTCGVNPCEIVGEKFEIASWDEIRMLKSAGLFKIVHHGHSHYPLSKFSTEEKLSRDIKANIEILKRKLKVEPYAFVYPFGKSDDYNEAAKEVLKNQGFEIAFTAQNKTDKIKAINYKNPFGIPRIILT